MNKLLHGKSKYVLLIISLIFLTLSIYYFIDHISDVGLRPFSNMSSDKMTSEEKFILHVNKPVTVFLLHNASVGSGYVKFSLVSDDGKVIEEYEITDDDFINKEYNLGKGSYYCTINRDVEKNKESFRFYYDKRHVEMEYLKNNSKTSNYKSY